VEREAVDLDDESVLGPQEVDLVGADTRVGPRRGQPGGADQGEQLPLGPPSE
jgi:hypothetical protein